MHWSKCGRVLGCTAIVMRSSRWDVHSHHLAFSGVFELPGALLNMISPSTNLASLYLAQVCSGILATTFLSICALSIAALVGLGSYWTYYSHNSSDPGAYYITWGSLPG